MKNPLDTLMSMVYPGEVHEWAKWETDFEYEMTQKTLCDVRRYIEDLWWKGFFWRADPWGYPWCWWSCYSASRVGYYGFMFGESWQALGYSFKEII